MAYPSENPVLAANFQFLFDGVRGADSAVESLRSALLGVAAVHQSFLLSRSGVSTLAAEEALRVADSFRAKSRHLLVSACATPEGCNNDAALAAAVAIALIDVSAAVRFLREETMSDYEWLCLACPFPHRYSLAAATGPTAWILPRTW